MYTETIEAEGHLIDSHLLEAVFDKVIEHGAKFEIVKFEIGRTNEQFSHLVMKVHAPSAGVLGDRKSTRLNSSHIQKSRMPSSA